MITNELISEIKSKINDNQKQAITGGVLQGVLVDMVKSLCEVYPQTYTDEEKAQARANIDALSNYDGEITKEKLSLEVQAILNDVANKQNITDASLATIAKTIVGAINELFNGGVKDKSIATSKIEDGAITEPKLDTDLVNIITSAVQPAELASAIATALASYVAKSDIVDTTGSATDKVMSQHGVTEAINGVNDKVTELESKVLPKVISNNAAINKIFPEAYFFGLTIDEIKSIKSVSFFTTDSVRGITLRDEVSSVLYQLAIPIEDCIEGVILLKGFGRINPIGMYALCQNQDWLNSREPVEFNITNVTNLSFSPSIAMKLMELISDSNIKISPDITIPDSRININGVVVSASGYYVSIIDVNKGDIIQFVSSANSSVAPISKLIDGEYIPTVIYDSSNIYNYISDFDGQLALSVSTSYEYYLTQIKSPLVGHIISKIQSKTDNTPMFRVENGNLEVSYDNGDTWNNLGYIQGDTGKLGYNDIIAVAKKNNKDSIVYCPSEAKMWQLADNDGELSEVLNYVYDDVHKQEIKAIKYTSKNNGRIILPLEQSVDMTSNVIRGSICIEKNYDTANLSHLIVEVYSNGIIDSAHRALMYIQQGQLNSEYNAQYVRAGWFHFNFCPDANISQNDRGSSFDITNITHLGIHAYHNVSIPLTIYVGDFSVTTPLLKAGVVTIIDNFDASVPNMADYAFSKGVRLNLSIIPNWIGTDASATFAEIERIKNQGHLIINHTWNHIIDTTSLSKADIVEEIIKSSEWMIKHGFARGARIVSNPSAMFPTNKYMAYMESPADIIYHHWTTMRNGGTDGTTLHYPFSPMGRLLNITTLDKCEEAIAAVLLAKSKGAIAVNGYHGRYWSEDGGVNWKRYIDRISELDVHHYTIDELLEGDFI